MILLTGGTGFVGRHLIQAFAADGRAVTVLTRTPGRVAFPDGVRCATGDLADPDSLRRALQGVQVVVHAAAKLPGPGVSAESLEQSNVRGTEAIAVAARAAGVSRFIHISSAGVYGDGASSAPHDESEPAHPGDRYERSKLDAEAVLGAALSGSRVCCTVLRPQGLYGADRPATAEFFRTVARRRIWLHGPQRVVVHPTHISDLVTAVRLTLDHADCCGEVINVAGSRPVELRELIAMIGARMGHAPAQFSAPRWTGRLAAGLAGGWGRFGTPPSRLRHQGRRWINRSVSIEKAHRLLGFRPLPLEEGLDRTAAELGSSTMSNHV